MDSNPNGITKRMDATVADRGVCCRKVRAELARAGAFLQQTTLWLSATWRPSYARTLAPRRGRDAGAPATESHRPPGRTNPNAVTRRRPYGCLLGCRICGLFGERHIRGPLGRCRKCGQCFTGNVSHSGTSGAYLCLHREHSEDV